MKVVNEDGSIKVQSDYQKEFVSKAKLIEGKWKAPYWVFPEENEEQVKALLMEIYAEDGTPQDTVDVMVNISALEDDDVLSLCGRILCSRRYRDGAVKLGSGVMLMQGGFPARGGSSKYPRVAPEEGTVLKVKNVPMSVYERIKEMPNVTLADDSENKKALHKKRLLEEKEMLLHRLAEINDKLEALESKEENHKN